MKNSGAIIIKGAREHNLKNIDLTIPRNKLIVITGLSGSGKSSLAFDTIYAEGQRRYVESLSSYARQFLEQLQKPDVEYIEGLSPAISIEQRHAGGNPRSTVGTATEIYDYLRLLYARIGTAHCYKCGRVITRQDAQKIVETVLKEMAGQQAVILAPLVSGRKGAHRQVFAEARKEGFIRVRVDGKVRELEEDIELNEKMRHSIEAVVDRVAVKDESRKRITDSVEAALRAGKGVSIVSRGEPARDTVFSEQNACVQCGISYGKLEPRMFSFNSPYGACPACDGLGNKIEIDPDLVVPDGSRPVIEAVMPWKVGGKGLILYYRRLLRSVAREHGFDVNSPFNALNTEQKEIIRYGDGEKGGYFEGIIPNLERRFHETESEYVKTEINKYMSIQPCPACKGKRLKRESLAVTIGGRDIMEFTAISVKSAGEFLSGLKFADEEKKVSYQAVKEIGSRLAFLANVGLDYLTLDRASSTLSGGEAQRIRLATQIGSGLVGVLYILDEPSIGLHQRDNAKLLNTLMALRDLGNTLIVVEHDEATIRAADYLIDLGPGAGELGGYVVAAGPLAEVLKSKESLTAQYLRGDFKIRIPEKRRTARKNRSIKIIGAREHNLKDIDIEIPLGLFVCVTGVSGSGKSTLVDEILYKALAKRLYRAKEKPGRHKAIKGIEHIDKVIIIDQSPIGRTPRSNPATYTGAYGPIRELFSRLPEARMRGYRPGRFSFNVKGGRCESCEGDGIKRIEMHFLPDVYILCEACKGRRFNEATLEVRYKGYSISDILAMSVGDALPLFANIPPIRARMQTLHDVGLGYVKLGQPATTLSGGEAQRVKLAAELSHRATGRTLYILDEPTTGLHFADIDKLLSVLQRLTDAGNTVLVIEHNLDVIKSADHIIDLGPEGGDGGGRLVAAGTPEEIAADKSSYTGAYLKGLA